MDQRHISVVGGGFSRRSFLKGGIRLGAAAGLAATGLDTWFDMGEAFADGATVTIPASGTAPEQVHLTVGDNAVTGTADPTSAITVSWLAPGTVAQPAPALVYSPLGAISASNPGVAATVQSTPFEDEMNLETAHTYHAPLTGLLPATTYHYQISDGATPPSTVEGSFTTAPDDAARTAWRFTSFGDLATPTSHLNPSATSWNESSDNAYYAVSAIAGLSPQPVVHLLNGDLCYANLNYNSQPAVWRDFFTNVTRSAASVPWMPCLGNHEIEFGSSSGANTSQPIFNGANGYGTYLSRFLLPDNGVSGLRGNFYSFQVGTVLFVSLDADDVIYQDGGSYYAPAAPGTAALTPSTPGTGVAIPPGASTYNNQYTGGLTVTPDANGEPAALTPAGTTPNAQTTWLEGVLSAARSTPNTLYPGKQPIDMIVVQMHQCALSSSSAGNGSDLGIRQAWLPLFDRYGVDLVLSGHEHNYERSFAVRGYTPTAVGTVVAPNPGQAAAGTPVFTRQPTVVPAAQGSVNGTPAFDTSQGTVFLVIGGGGTDGPTDIFGVDANGNPVAKVITQRNKIYQTGSGAWTKNPADSTEPAPWSAMRDGVSSSVTGATASAYDSWGYATFDVDPGLAPGDTSITMTYYHAPVAGGMPGKYVGTTAFTPYETIVFQHAALASPPAATPEFPTVVGAGVAAAAVGGAAVYFASERSRGDSEPHQA